MTPPMTRRARPGTRHCLLPRSAEAVSSHVPTSIEPGWGTHIPDYPMPFYGTSVPFSPHRSQDEVKAMEITEIGYLLGAECRVPLRKPGC